MEKQWKERIKDFFPKETEGKKKKITWEDIGFTRLLVIVLAGLALLVLSLPTGGSSGKKGNQEKAQENGVQKVSSQDAAWIAMSEYAQRQEKKTEEILSQVEGVGKVDVMLTIAATEEKITLQNETVSEENTEETDHSGGSRIHSNNSLQKDNVLVEGEEGDVPYVVQVQSPVIEGVVVVAEGAGDGNINTEIIEAVEALFPIEPHKIKVMRMD